MDERRQLIDQGVADIVAVLVVPTQKPGRGTPVGEQGRIRCQGFHECRPGHRGPVDSVRDLVCVACGEQKNIAGRPVNCMACMGDHAVAT